MRRVGDDVPEVARIARLHAPALLELLGRRVPDLDDGDAVARHVVAGSEELARVANMLRSQVIEAIRRLRGAREWPADQIEVMARYPEAVAFRVTSRALALFVREDVPPAAEQLGAVLVRVVAVLSDELASQPATSLRRLSAMGILGQQEALLAAAHHTIPPPASVAGDELLQAIRMLSGVHRTAIQQRGQKGDTTTSSARTEDDVDLAHALHANLTSSDKLLTAGRGDASCASFLRQILFNQRIDRDRSRRRRRHIEGDIEAEGGMEGAAAGSPSADEALDEARWRAGRLAFGLAATGLSEAPSIEQGLRGLDRSGVLDRLWYFRVLGGLQPEDLERLFGDDLPIKQDPLEITDTPSTWTRVKVDKLPQQVRGPLEALGAVPSPAALRGLAEAVATLNDNLAAQDEVRLALATGGDDDVVHALSSWFIAWERGRRRRNWINVKLREHAQGTIAMRLGPWLADSRRDLVEVIRRSAPPLEARLVLVVLSEPARLARLAPVPLPRDLADRALLDTRARAVFRDALRAVFGEDAEVDPAATLEAIGLPYRLDGWADVHQQDPEVAGVADVADRHVGRLWDGDVPGAITKAAVAELATYLACAPEGLASAFRQHHEPLAAELVAAVRGPLQKEFLGPAPPLDLGVALERLVARGAKAVETSEGYAKKARERLSEGVHGAAAVTLFAWIGRRKGATTRR